MASDELRVRLKRVALDVLKPHQPNGLAFSTTIAQALPGGRVMLTVAEVDENTETVILVIEGDDLIYEDIAAAIADLGGTIHSIDEVEVHND